MAIRVDDIVVTEKNVLLLSGGHQFIVDIERESDSSDSENSNRQRNPWNFYSSDGELYHNIFNTNAFDIRTQVLTGSTRHSPNNSRSHERIYMPSDVSYVGICQFYDNGYSITDFTNSSISSDISSSGGYCTYSSDDGFIRYDVPEAYENPTECYIAPKYLYDVDSGVQFMTEYPLNGMYSDFGDNESEGRPTLFADSVLTKYWLDSNYSVSSYEINDETENTTYSNFRQFRTYYGIGTTGNSIYAVYRNNRYGESSEVDDANLKTSLSDGHTVNYPASAIGYMSNIVVMCGSDTIKYSSDPYSDMFDYDALSSVMDSISILEPSDRSFILFVKDNGSSTTFTYLPKIGLERSTFVKVLDEPYSVLSIVELEHSIAIGTREHGILTVWSRDYLYDGGDTLVSFNPFQSACSGIPSFESLSSKIDGDVYGNIKLFYNGRDILGATAEVGGTEHKRIAFFSSTFDDGTHGYEIGQFFMPAGNPSYEIVAETTTETHYTSSLSSVPVPSYAEGSTETITSWSYVLTSVEVVSSVDETTFDGFSCSANYVSDINLLFDYSSSAVEDALSVGSYAFVQFDGYGLGMCHVGDIYSDPKMVKFSSTGPINRYDGNVRKCTDVRFSVESYGADLHEKMMEDVDYAFTDYNTRYVDGTPALRATFVNGDGRYENSFTVFPLSGRDDVVNEPIFSSIKLETLETCPISTFKYALEKPIPNSMGVSVKTFAVDGINHDAAISLVEWNRPNGISSVDANTPSPSGLHLQYNGICTDVYMNGSVTPKMNDATGEVYPYYSSTVYEYPHPCFGELKTAGTGLSIFEGPLSSSMEMDDMFFVNGYFVVKNYAVGVFEGHTEEYWKSMDDGDTIWGSGKHSSHDSGAYPYGGYVVTNFFADKGMGCEISSLYDSELVVSSKLYPKTAIDSERFYDYEYLWHIKPTKPIEFYPESRDGVVWHPYYVTKYVDFIRYHNGYYYISLRSKKNLDEDGVVGYDIIETDTLFVEKEVKALDDGVIVSDVKFFDSHVAVEYTDISNGTKYIKWFESGKSAYKTMPVEYAGGDPYGSMKRAVVDTSEDYSSLAAASYDNVEVIDSLNRFTPIVNHKSNLFSIRIDDLGFEDSPYLSEYQKTVLRTYFRNSITELVNAVKPAHTQLFDVYLS